MTAKVKSVLAVAGEAFETAAGYALVAAGLYAVLFVDMTGGGSLWKSLHHIREVSQEGLESPNAARIVKVPTQPVVEKAHEDRMLAVFDSSQPEGSVSALYQAPDASTGRPSAAFTDTPADPKSGKTWKRGIQGSLRSFTVYGKGDQTTSAAVSTARGASAPAPVVAVASAEGSAARAETAAAARPGVGSRLSRGALSASETSRNIR